MMRILLSNIFIICILCLPIYSSASGQCVILLHGMGRTHHSMDSMAAYFKTHHYTVVNRSYHSTQKTISDLAENELPPMITACNKYSPDQIHFVTHSLGGIVLRKYLQHHHISNLGRIVMLSPPNHGSPLADFLKDNWLYQKLLGPAGQELTTAKSSTPNSLPSANPYQVGIITGSFNLFGNVFFHEINDGKVSASSAKLNGMQDFIVLPVTHAFMMRNPDVMQQVLVFIESGKFRHTSDRNNGGHSLRA